MVPSLVGQADVAKSGLDSRPQHGQVGRYDLDELAVRLRECAADWVPDHFPRGRREGQEWRLANISGDAPRKNGSCVIALEGEHAGDWIDFDGGEGGGPIDTLARATGRTGRDLYDYAAELVGVTPARGATPRKPPAEGSNHRKDVRREIEAILAETVPITGTVAEAWLSSAG
jgi:putative DNA primase/helicase